MRRAAQRHKLSWIVVAHPTKDFNKYRKRTKDGEDDGPSPVPTLYDIESCYSDDTEVLTKRGWLHHGQLTMSDDVANLSGLFATSTTVKRFALVATGTIY
jgi:hypothetical protein